jgi:hypothetical protein
MLPSCAKFDKDALSNAAAITKAFGPQYQLIRDLTDYQFALAATHAFGLPEHPDSPKHSPLLLSVVYKNLINFYSITRLIEAGLHGPARALLRYAFEGAVIAKYCTCRSDFQLFEKWDSGKYIHLTNDILNKIRSPDTKPFRTFWTELCQFTHATNSSMQVGLQFDFNRKDIYSSITLTLILLRMNYHILNTHILTRLVRYYALRYGTANFIAKIRHSGRPLLYKARQFNSRKAGILVKNFKSTWNTK